MGMQETTNDKNYGLRGGHFARTEDELYKKAITLLNKCKIETQHAYQEMPELQPLPDTVHSQHLAVVAKEGSESSEARIPVPLDA